MGEGYGEGIGAAKGRGHPHQKHPIFQSKPRQTHLPHPFVLQFPLTLDPLLISPWEGEGWLLAGEGTPITPAPSPTRGEGRTPPILAKLAFHHVCNKPGPG